jgi:hypothetical protein
MKNVENPDYSQDIDDITKDELNYDEESISRTMDVLFEMTKENSQFRELYELAAGKMLSTDRLTGQAILFSYDYLADFHHCIVAYLENPMEWNENIHYIKLKSRLLL